MTDDPAPGIDPIATPDDLATFMGAGTVDTERAALFIKLAQDLAESRVSPLPDAAVGIVLTSAARGYLNPQGVTGETVGPYTVQRPAQGVYFNRYERAALRAMNGAGQAFTVDPLAATAGVGLPWWDVDTNPSITNEVWRQSEILPP